MARYGWNLYELRSRLLFLKNIYDAEKDEGKREVIFSSIQEYQKMINMAIKRTSDNHSILNDNLEYQDFNSLIQEQIISYQTNDSSIINTVLQSYLPFKESYTSQFDLDNIYIVSTNDQLMTISDEFISKMIPASVRKSIFDIDGFKKNIQFSYSKYNDCYSGMTIFEPIFDEKYIYISRTNMLIDLVTLPHELFHYVFNDSDVGEMNDYNMYYTCEIEGGFANILFSDYFYNNAYQYNNYFSGYFLEVFHSGISEMVVRNAFVSSVRKNGNFRMNKFNKELSWWGIIPFTDKDEIVDYLVDPLDKNLKYTLGYLVGIDLYYIYQRDPEFAFYLLKNIRYMRHENDVLGLLRKNHITFMDDGYENLKKYVKKIERQN